MTDNVWLFTLLAILIPLIVAVVLIFLLRVSDSSARSLRVRRAMSLTIAAAYVFAAVTIRDVPRSRMVWYLLAAAAWGTVGFLTSRERKQ